jgi:hypothetical protein
MNKPLTKTEWEASVAETWSAVIKSTFADEIKAAVEAEREACAKLCEEPGWNAANWCAKQIRARGNNAS